MIILASKSMARQSVLAQSQLSFITKPAAIDERALEAPLLSKGASPKEIAQYLANEKALDISKKYPDAIVIGSDQILDFDGQRLVKVRDRHSAKERLTDLAGKSHYLHSALSCAKKGNITLEHIETSELTMRLLSSTDIDNYLDRVGDDIFQSVGCYQLEGYGVTLFEAIKGDYFSILGLPLLPLLSHLRSQGLSV